MQERLETGYLGSKGCSIQRIHAGQVTVRTEESRKSRWRSGRWTGHAIVKIKAQGITYESRK